MTPVRRKKSSLRGLFRMPTESPVGALAPVGAPAPALAPVNAPVRKVSHSAVMPLSSSSLATDGNSGGSGSRVDI